MTNSKEQTITRHVGLVFTTLYSVLLLPLLWIASYAAIAVKKPQLSEHPGLLLFVAFATPLSIPISIVLLWFSYRKKAYLSSLYFCTLPLQMYIVALIVEKLFGLLRH